MEFVAATNNAHKLAEMRRILVRMGHTVLSQREAGVLLEPEETGATFEANAAIKAQAVCEACRKPTIADDSGLCVDALGGAPGVYSARYSGVHGDDGANNRKLLAALEGVPAARRAAHLQAPCACGCRAGATQCMWAGALAPSALRKREKTALGTTRCSSRTRWACRAGARHARQTPRSAPTPSFRRTKRTPSATAPARWP